MKRSEIVFIGITVIFLIYGIVTAPLNMSPVDFGESVLGSLVLGLVWGFILSWIFKKLTHEDRQLVPDPQIAQS